jgi:hypothetical protein
MDNPNRVKFNEATYNEEDVLIGGLLFLVSSHGYPAAFAMMNAYIQTNNIQYIPYYNNLREVFIDNNIREYVLKTAKLKNKSIDKYIDKLYKKNSKSVEQLNNMIHEFNYIFNKLLFLQRVEPKRMKFLIESFNALTPGEKFYINFNFPNFKYVTDRIQYAVDTTIEERYVPTPQVDAVMGRKTKKPEPIIPNNYANAPKAQRPKVKQTVVDNPTHEPIYNQPEIAANSYINNPKNKNRFADDPKEEHRTYMDYIPKEDNRPVEKDEAPEEKKEEIQKNGKNKELRKEFAEILEDYNKISEIENVTSIKSVEETLEKCINDRKLIGKRRFVHTNDQKLAKKRREVLCVMERYELFLCEYKKLITEYIKAAESIANFDKKLSLIASIEMLIKRCKKDIPTNTFKKIKEVIKGEKNRVYEEEYMRVDENAREGDSRLR